MSWQRILFSGFLLWGLMGCTGPATDPSTDPSYDYSAFREHMPRSILVLPPLNESVEVGAPHAYLTTVTKSVAERGYYIFPVSVVEAYMKDNGLPTAGEMHSASLNKIGEIIGADAVLYLTIVDWGQKYQVVNSKTVVSVRARLVDVPSGTTLWTGDVRVVWNSTDREDNLAEALVGAIIVQIENTVRDAPRLLAKRANRRMFFNKENGLLVGPLHPEFGVTGDDQM